MSFDDNNYIREIKGYNKAHVSDNWSCKNECIRQLINL